MLYAASHERPHVILVFADDMGIDSVAAFNPGLGMPTPNLDAFAAAGVSFMDAHSASAVCTPTRYGLLTGRYPWRSSHKTGVAKPYDPPLIADALLTMPEMLRDAGYQTAMFGKWHLGYDLPRLDPAQGVVYDAKGKNPEGNIDWQAMTKPGAIEGGPVSHGFDVYFGDEMPNYPPFTWFENDRITAVPTVFKSRSFTHQQSAVSYTGAAGMMVDGWDFTAVLPEITKRTCDYITEHAADEAPFFVYFSLTSPHSPIMPSAEFIGSCGIDGYTYGDWIVQTDACLGQVVDAVAAAGIAEETVIIFTTDNGTEQPFARNNAPPDYERMYCATVRDWKRALYEGGHRVPFIVQWPGLSAAGTRSDTVMCTNDIMATLADHLGLELPPAAAVDSESFLGGLAGQPFARSPVVHVDIKGNLALRDGQWKALFTAAGLELYDMVSDPKETTNLAAAESSVAAEMATTLRTIVDNGRSTPGAVQSNDPVAQWPQLDQITTTPAPARAAGKRQQKKGKSRK
ncbi:MAG: sulfatase family protein [Planctomycetota bacterium]